MGSESSRHHRHHSNGGISKSTGNNIDEQNDDIQQSQQQQSSSSKPMRRMDRIRRSLSFRKKKKDKSSSSSSNNNNNTAAAGGVTTTPPLTLPATTTTTTPSPTNVDTTKPLAWQEDERKVRDGTCSFHVKYLGSIEVLDSRGMHICEQAIERLLAQKRKPIKAILYVSGDSLRVVDEVNKTLIVDQTIEKVSFCAPDRHHDNGFAYICRDGTTRRWLCHGFMAIKETLRYTSSNSSGGERLSHAVGCAFSVCLEKKQKRERENVSMEVGPNHSFTRLGSFRQASITERLEDPQIVMPAVEPLPIRKVDNPYAIERPKGKMDILSRQNSLRNSFQTTPFKRTNNAYQSLKPGELPSFQQQKLNFNTQQQQQLLLQSDSSSSTSSSTTSNNITVTNPSSNDKLINTVISESPEETLAQTTTIEFTNNTTTTTASTTSTTNIISTPTQTANSIQQPLTVNTSSNQLQFNNLITSSNLTPTSQQQQQQQQQQHQMTTMMMNTTTNQWPPQQHQQLFAVPPPITPIIPTNQTYQITPSVFATPLSPPQSASSINPTTTTTTPTPSYYSTTVPHQHQQIPPPLPPLPPNLQSQYTYAPITPITNSPYSIQQQQQQQQQHQQYLQQQQQQAPLYETFEAKWARLQANKKQTNPFAEDIAKKFEIKL